MFYADPVCGTTLADMRIGYRGLSERPTHPQGFGVYGDMPAWEVAQYRYANRNRACRWTSLPQEVRDVVLRDLKETGEAETPDPVPAK